LRLQVLHLLVQLLLAVVETARGGSRDEQEEDEAADESSSHGTVFAGREDLPPEAARPKCYRSDRLDGTDDAENCCSDASFAVPVGNRDAAVRLKGPI